MGVGRNIQNENKNLHQQKRKKMAPSLDDMLFKIKINMQA